MSGFFCVLASADGSPSDIDVGGSATENGAVRVALRAANEYECAVFVFGRDGVQRQVVHPGATIQPTEPPPPPQDKPLYDRHRIAGSPLEIVGFVLEWTAKGYTVTVSPISAVTLLQEAEASKRNA